MSGLDLAGSFGVAAVLTLLVLTALVVLVLPQLPQSRIRGVRAGQGPAEDVGISGATAEASRPGPLTAVVRAVCRRSRKTTVEAAEWVVWMRQLAALLRVGRSSASAFDVAAQSLAEAPAPSPTGLRIQRVCATVARGAVVGRTPSESLRTLSDTPAPGHPRLRAVEATVLADLARCWEVSERTGAPLAALLEGLAEATEADLDAAAARETALAGSRATVKILTWLPVLALGLGILIGADPLRTLLTTPWGMAAGLMGAVLTVIGRIWTGRMVRVAEHVTEHRGPASAAGKPTRGHRARNTAQGVSA